MELPSVVYASGEKEKIILTGNEVDEKFIITSSLNLLLWKNHSQPLNIQIFIV